MWSPKYQWTLIRHEAGKISVLFFLVGGGIERPVLDYVIVITYRRPMRREYLIKRKIRNTYTFRLGQLGQLVHQIVDGNMTSDVPVEAAQRCCNRRRCNVARRINWKIVFWKAEKKLWFRTRRFSRNIFSWNAGCLSLKELFTLSRGFIEVLRVLPMMTMLFC